MFPLGTVLFPGTVIPLQVFEPRYAALVGHCLEHDSRLGIVLIERGSEVGGGDVRFDVGTQGRIAEAAPLPDGRWILVVVGERRIRVRRWLPEQPFPRAEVAYEDDDDVPPGSAAEQARAGLRGPNAVAGLERRLWRALAMKADLGEWQPDDVTPQLAADPATAGWQVAASGLIGPVDAQRLLETTGVDARLALLASLLDDEIAVLALRAAGG